VATSGGQSSTQVAARHRTARFYHRTNDATYLQRAALTARGWSQDRDLGLKADLETANFGHGLEVLRLVLGVGLPLLVLAVC